MSGAALKVASTTKEEPLLANEKEEEEEEEKRPSILPTLPVFYTDSADGDEADAGEHEGQGEV